MNKKEKNIIEYFTKNQTYTPNFQSIEHKLNYSFKERKKRRKFKWIFIGFTTSILTCGIITICLLINHSQQFKPTINEACSAINPPSEENSTDLDLSYETTEIISGNEGETQSVIIYDNQEYIIKTLNDFPFKDEAIQLTQIETESFGKIDIYQYQQNLYGYIVEIKQWIQLIKK